MTPVEPAPAAASSRSLTLDALRGVAILGMVFSGTLPWNSLPAWMYHAQLPPPERVFIATLPGITWVDLVFPLFLFAMGAAFPFAFSRRLETGTPRWRLGLGVLERGFLLGFFAIFLAHIRPYALAAEPGAATWLLALLGFVLLFPIYTRLPGEWPLRWRCSLRAAGWIGAILFLSLATYRDGTGFSVQRRDIILVILTNTAIFGGAVWLLWGRRTLALLGVMAIVLAAWISMNHPGWTQSLKTISPIPWLIQAGHLRYLLVVIPGMMAGEVLLAWMRTSAGCEKSPRVGPLLGLAGLMVVLVALVLTGLQGRWMGFTLGGVATGGLAAWWLTRGDDSPTWHLLRALMAQGFFWVALGLIFEPYEGGIKKDPSTLSYFFVSAGLSVFLLAGLFIIIDSLRQKKWAAVLVANGQNPMIAYVAFGSLLLPLFSLFGLNQFLIEALPGPWLGLIRAVFYTALVAVFVWTLSRLKVFWRT